MALHPIAAASERPVHLLSASSLHAHLHSNIMRQIPPDSTARCCYSTATCKGTKARNSKNFQSNPQHEPAPSASSRSRAVAAAAAAAAASACESGAIVTEIWLPAISMLSSCCMALVASDVALYLRQHPPLSSADTGYLQNFLQHGLACLPWERLTALYRGGRGLTVQRPC